MSPRNDDEEIVSSNTCIRPAMHSRIEFPQQAKELHAHFKGIHGLDCALLRWSGFVSMYESKKTGE